MRDIQIWRRIRAVKTALLQRAGSKCLHCGYDGTNCQAAMEFHHRDRSLKRFKLSGDELLRPLKEIYAEADKCDLLCCRCHRELYYAAKG